MNIKIRVFVSLLCLTYVLAAPPSTTESLVVVTKSTPKESNGDISKDEDTALSVPKIYSMRVDTNVTNRFATTLVTSKVKNLKEKPQEATFSVVLPDTAYISGFIMEIDGKKYEAYVQEKEEAKKTYENAVASGMGAGHVAVSARDSNRFTVSINIEPESKATFYLKYEELLRRQKGQYEIVINLHPGQPVKDLEVQININESRSLAFVKAPSLRSGNEISKNDEKLDPKAQIEHIDETKAKVIFKPDIERQKEFAKNLGSKEGDGLAGQFIVQYDVKRDPEGGEILLSDGYFVHFFAPTDLKPLPKHITFVLDTSGSMYGTKIEQLKVAMKSILGQLNKEDSFNIIEFNSEIKVWNIPKIDVQYREGYRHFFTMDSDSKISSEENKTIPGSFEVSQENIENARQVVEKFVASGGTNIDLAFEVTFKLLQQNKLKDERQPIIMFLTDGQPAGGESDTVILAAKVTKQNVDQIPIFSLSFGSGADRNFLEKLSLKNQGFARHIYEGSDASLQLESFYKYISSPLLTKVNFKYVSKQVSRITLCDFPILFDGSELVVAGKYDLPLSNENETSTQPKFDSVVTSSLGHITKQFHPKFENPIGSLEKHWAYLTIKQILEKRDVADNKTELTKKALDLALKYSLVTPVSSLVVVKPNNTKSESNPEDASKGSVDNLIRRKFVSAGLPGAAYRPMYSAPSPSFISNAQSQFYVPLRAEISVPHLSMIPHHGIRGSHFTTTFRPMIFTTEVTKQEKIPEVFDTLKRELPWFVNIFNSQNKTLSLPQGQYLLDTTDLILDAPKCTNTPMNTTGTCTLLKDCAQIHKLLTDLPTYLQHFCPLKGYAGVCCPVTLKV